MLLSCTAPATSGSRTGPSRRSSKPTDAVIRLAATCICGSDLWPYCGVEPLDRPRPMGHEYAGIVEEVGSAVTTVQPGQFVVGSFFASDNTCEICQAGYHSPPASTVRPPPRAARRPNGCGCRWPTAPWSPPLTCPATTWSRSLLAASDVLGTGWFAAVAAEAGPGKTVAVVGDGAVGLLGVLAAKQLGAERIIAMSRHAAAADSSRSSSAPPTSSTNAATPAWPRIKDLTDGLGAHSVIEAVGTQESMMQAIRATRPGGHMGYVGVNHDVLLPGEELFFSHVHLHGGPAPVRRFLPDLIDRIWNRQIDPGKVFDLELPLDEAAAGYQAMNDRKAIKVLLRTGPSLSTKTEGV